MRSVSSELKTCPVKCTRRINRGSRAYFAFGVPGREYFNALNVCAHERARTWTGNILRQSWELPHGYELCALDSNERLTSAKQMNCNAAYTSKLKYLQGLARNEGLPSSFIDSSTLHTCKICVKCINITANERNTYVIKVSAD